MRKLPRDLALLVARVTIGVVFAAHGWQRWRGGLGPTEAMFIQAGVPWPRSAAMFTMVAELVGGSLLVVGLLVRLAAFVLVVVAIGAIVFVHAGHGIFVQDNGWELAGALGAGCLLLVATGGGRLGADGAFVALRRSGGRHRRPADEESAEIDRLLEEENGRDKRD
ncbi:DoxX family protein [Thermoactinospora rubra]|uniref:DoxX family protein n=1 Tax=Thermoactinospora rubra TaxID=1088767 RepID=UPI000A0FCEA5|nr:DoxX family protein [Thermoactinospora rubra]